MKSLVHESPALETPAAHPLTYPSMGQVQGRLIQSPPGALQWFPQAYWRSEFFLAAALGFDYIELIAEREYNPENPLWRSSGLDEIKALAQRNGLQLKTFCQDHIIDYSLTDGRGALDQTLRLIGQGAKLGMEMLILPLFEAGELNMDNLDLFKGPLHEIGDAASEQGITVCLETILEGQELLGALDYLGHANLKCVYDTGNRIAFHHDIYRDIRLLGDAIVHVHIKDKNSQSENVRLGTGLVDFARVFEALADIGYAGPMTFETTRGNDPIRTARYNKRLVEYFYAEAYH